MPFLPSALPGEPALPPVSPAPAEEVSRAFAASVQELDNVVLPAVRELAESALRGNPGAAVEVVLRVLR
jgi:hypothetical protein